MNVQMLIPLDRAIDVLREQGHVVEPADMPGLYNVSGFPELTTHQLLAVAAKYVD